jgi:AraC family transcriptional regulator of arabinose operon
LPAFRPTPRTFEHYWIAFTGTEAEDLFNKSSLARLGTIHIDKNTTAIIEQIIVKSKENIPYAQEICSSHLKILLLSLTQGQIPEPTSQSRAMQSFQRCRRYIDENFSKINSPLQAASACDINIRYMSRLFKSFGIANPHKYISRLKLNKAANLLLTSNLSIGQIAKDVGFEDPYHFSRNFRLFHSTSPQNYRKTHIE